MRCKNYVQYFVAWTLVYYSFLRMAQHMFHLSCPALHHYTIDALSWVASSSCHACTWPSIRPAMDFSPKLFSMLFWWVISSETSAYLLTLASSNQHCNSVQILLGTIICAFLFWWVISSERSAYLLTLPSSIHHCNSVQNLLGTIICAFYFTLPQSAFWALPKKIDHWYRMFVFSLWRLIWH